MIVETALIDKETKIKSNMPIGPVLDIGGKPITSYPSGWVRPSHWLKHDEWEPVEGRDKLSFLYEIKEGEELLHWIPFRKPVVVTMLGEQTIVDNGYRQRFPISYENIPEENIVSTGVKQFIVTIENREEDAGLPYMYGYTTMLYNLEFQDGPIEILYDSAHLTQINLLSSYFYTINIVIINHNKDTVSLYSTFRGGKALKNITFRNPVHPTGIRYAFWTTGIDIPSNLFFDRLTGLWSMFYDCRLPYDNNKTLTFNSNEDVTMISNVGYRHLFLEHLSILNITSPVTVDKVVRYCYNLRSITMDCTHVTGTLLGSYNYRLRDINLTNVSIDVDLSRSSVDNESLTAFFTNGLVDMTGQESPTINLTELKLGQTIDDEVVAIATNKNWEVLR